MRNCAAQNKSARLKPDDLVDVDAGIGVQHLVDGHTEPARVGEKRGHIAKHDPFVREIDNGTDVILNLFHAVLRSLGFGRSPHQRNNRATALSDPPSVSKHVPQRGRAGHHVKNRTACLHFAK